MVKVRGAYRPAVATTLVDVPLGDSASLAEILGTLSLAESLVASDPVKNSSPNSSQGRSPDDLQLTANLVQKIIDQIQDMINLIGERLSGQFGIKAIAEGAELVALSMEEAAAVLNGHRQLSATMTVDQAALVYAFQQPQAETARPRQRLRQVLTVSHG